MEPKKPEKIMSQEERGLLTELNEVQIAWEEILETRLATSEEEKAFSEEFERLRTEIEALRKKEIPDDTKEASAEASLPIEEEVELAKNKLEQIKKDEDTELAPIHAWYADQIRNLTQEEKKAKLDGINKEYREKQDAVKTKYKKEREEILNQTRERLADEKKKDLETIPEYKKEYAYLKSVLNPSESQKNDLRTLKIDPVQFFKSLFSTELYKIREQKGGDEQVANQYKEALTKILDIQEKYDRMLIELGEKNEHDIWYTNLLNDLAEEDARQRGKQKPVDVLEQENNENNIEVFGQAYLEQEIENIIKQFSQKLEEKGLKYKGIEINPKQKSIEIVAKLKGGFVTGNPNFLATIESTEDGRIIVTKYELKANMAVKAFVDKDKIKDLAESIGEKVREYIEQKNGKEVERMDIENGALKVTYKK